MRHSQTEPVQTLQPPPTDGWNPDLAERVETGTAVDAVERAGRASDRPDAATSAGSWQDIKSRFVDDPAGAIAAAEQLVQRAVDERVRALQDEATALCAREHDEDGASATETLRTRLLRYQQYCERLAGNVVH